MEHGIVIWWRWSSPPIQRVITGNGRNICPFLPFFGEEDGFWSQFSLSQFWPLSSSLVLPKGREDKFEGLKGGGELGYGASLGGPLCDAYNPTLGLFLVLVYIRQVTTTRQDQNTQHTTQRPNKHHHHGGGAVNPSGGVDLMNPRRLRGGRPCPWFFQGWHSKTI